MIDAKSMLWLAAGVAAGAAAYALITWNRIPGAKPFSKKADPEQLRKGIEVELEHTTNRRIAETIARQHLDEFPDYYTRLERMERGLCG